MQTFPSHPAQPTHARVHTHAWVDMHIDILPTQGSTGQVSYSQSHARMGIHKCLSVGEPWESLDSMVSKTSEIGLENRAGGGSHSPSLQQNLTLVWPSLLLFFLY